MTIFRKKKSDIFHISAQNIDCGYSLEPPHRGGSNEYPQSMFWAEITKIMYAPVNPSFTIQKWGLRGSKLYRYVFLMVPSGLCAHQRMKSAFDFAQSGHMKKRSILASSEGSFFLSTYLPTYLPVTLKQSYLTIQRTVLWWRKARVYRD